MIISNDNSYYTLQPDYMADAALFSKQSFGTNMYRLKEYDSVGEMLILLYNLSQSLFY